MFEKSCVVSVLVIATINHVFCRVDVLDLGSKNAVWTVENKNGSQKLPATVPGGIYSDLQNAGMIGDIFSGFNDVLTRWVAYDTWTYTGRFYVNEAQMETKTAHLVFHGLDTVAFVHLNDAPIGSTNNMFVRYVFDVKDHLKAGENVLKVEFTSPIEAARVLSDNHFTAPDCVPSVYKGECHANQLRKMQASFSWDWGPAFPSVGIWQPATIEFYNGAIIRSVTTFTEKGDTKWRLKIKTYLESSLSTKQLEGHLSAVLSVEGRQTIRAQKEVNVHTKEDGTAELDIDMVVNEDLIKLWWPNGYGEQNLYDLRVFLSTQGAREEVSRKHVRIGFRTIELIQEDASRVLGNTTAGQGLTFYFKINGYPLFMKGSNWIPGHILPEYGGDKSLVDGLLTAARDAHMAMLRVWGGGIYESDYFYQKCDELGILIWQDFLFACSMYPAYPEFLDNVKIEILQNVIRLQHHPSIALWAGNNENESALRDNWYDTLSQFEKYKEEYIKLYVDTIKPIVTDVDNKEYIVSSPSNGLKSEQEGYIAEDPSDSYYGDRHYYSYTSDNWDMNTYPQTRFASEYGFQSLPSVATMRTATKNPEDFRVDSEYSKHRQHSPNGYTYIAEQMKKHLKLDENDPKYFDKFVFQSQISQAMAIKAESEFYRQGQADWYTMGALYWQLNDVWQAPSWSGIEHGGKWKMLHYYAKWFFAPILVSPRPLLSEDVDVYLINDRFVPIVEAHIIVEVFNWSSLTPIRSQSYPANVDALSAKKQDIKLTTLDLNTDETFLRFTLTAPGVPSSPYNYVFPKPFKSISGLREPRIQINVSRPRRTGHYFYYPVDIQVDTVVLFLWLETSEAFNDHHSGYFEDNGVIIANPYLRTNFISKDVLSPKYIENAITYQYYMN
ncbi:beta-mannosidase-like [Amyelois transitella]|uniref:beta-mannosidase-like n=1 Tax=Amyelois transitella TaxID=680683 RepID=UPI0029902FC3|nr:beta-mannosidase-like [Amyelois transitella]